MQAARGTTSHFNLGSHFDAAVFAVMGISIGCIWLAILLLTVALFRQPFVDSASGWSLRLGMLLAVIGAGSGGLMTVPNSKQLAPAHATGRLPIAGAHTVGAPDGGRGLPVTGWSADHGDLRIARFLGMHGLQVLPLFAWWIARRKALTLGAAEGRTADPLRFARDDKGKVCGRESAVAKGEAGGYRDTLLPLATALSATNLSFVIPSLARAWGPI